MTEQPTNERPTPARLRVDLRQARRRERMAERMAQAATPGARVGVAAEHLRAVLAHLPEQRAAQFADQVVRDLLAVIEQAYQEEK